MIVFVLPFKFRNMKTILTLLLLVLSAPMMAQTNIISLKSHAGDIAQIDKETDNFGEPPWKMGVDSVIFVKKGVIVECGYGMRRDTVRSKIYDGYLTDRMRDYYAPNCVFVGFKESKNANHAIETDSNQNGVSWIIALILILIMLNYKKFKTQFSSFGMIVFLASISLLSTNVSAQTNIISLKSHAGDLAQLNEEVDNFGAIYQPPTLNPVQTVKFIRPGVIVEYRESRFQSQYPITNDKNAVQQEIDTLKNPYYTKNLTPEFKRGYPATTVFVGFNREHSDAAKPYFDSIHKNGISLLAFLLLAGIGIGTLFINTFQKTKAC